jgi:DNA invertase Pin-like site-specific DNA recombinase
MYNTTEKANNIIHKSRDFGTKRELAMELGISRPTLDTRLDESSKWKKLEIKWIDKLYNDLK